MSKKEQPFNNPFSGLKLKQHEAEKKPQAAPPPREAKKQKPTALDEESALFLESVGAVEKVRTTKTRVGPPEPPSAAQLKIPNEEAESLARLAELVSGQGEFDLADSDEFIEGSVHGFDPNVMRKLRAGEFSVQAHLDLHGLTRDEAKPKLDAFIQKSRIDGHRCVLVITGRGLHSKDQIPVLKEGVQQWLARGKQHKQVLAFCTARPKDGGAGAVYVLLRR
ncbi:MAG: Smr/MutS family protein [Archangium sp.]|nr:Smr/MutS family protein [Archangium sp.]